MNNAKVIGIGAAGNKAVIGLIEKNVLPRNNVMLLNSTLKDIPAGYKDIAIEFSGASKGCGKERDIAKRIVLESMQNGTVSFDSFLDPQDKMVIIVTSSEGGTGCGGASIVGKYFKEVLKANVHMFVFTGFEEDGRGLKNTVEYFQELSEEYTVQAISNKKFLAAANGNKLKAETFANIEFARRIKILLGQLLVDSENNIDETDLTKLTTTAGFMMIEYGELDKVKNVESFNKVVSDIIDNTKSLDIEPTAKRIGVILNISERTKDSIDYLFTVIKEKLGTPFETYTHVQTEQEPEYIAIIASGLKMPTADVMAIYDRYKEAAGKVDKSKDSFFEDLNMDLKDDNDVFNMVNKPKSGRQLMTDKNNFFMNFSPSSRAVDQSTKFINTTKKTAPEEDEDDDKPKIEKY